MFENLTELFCDVDDFMAELENFLKKMAIGKEKKSSAGRKEIMHKSEIMTLIILYHQSGFKNFKVFYMHVSIFLKTAFPTLLSYNRFLEKMSECFMPLVLFLQTRFGENTGISFIDSTRIKVCENIRINRNQVFKGLAKRGKSSMGWFYGFKLHIVVNERGELLNFAITRGNEDDRKPASFLCKNLSGKVFGDKGYISKKLFQKLWEKGIHLITNIRSNMKNKFVNFKDKILLRKRFIIETINDQLKNISDIEHTRHRSPTNFFVNIISGLIAYTYQDKKPSIKWPNSMKLIK